MAANKITTGLADGPMVHYLYINDKFFGNVRLLSKTVMPDRLHPREHGYAIYAEAIEPTVAKRMTERQAVAPPRHASLPLLAS